jgi:hypothetical protein
LVEPVPALIDGSPEVILLSAARQAPLLDGRRRELFQKLAACDPGSAALMRAGIDHGWHRRGDDRYLWCRARAYDEEACDACRCARYR